jgi:hypothetical protein
MIHACEGRDELLLKFAHGQLGLWQRMQVRWHVRRCPACTGRLERFSMLSSALAVAMASGSGPRWLPSSGGVKWGVPRSVLLGGIIAILTLGLWSLRNSAQAIERSESGKPGVTVPQGGACHPPVPGAAKQMEVSPSPDATIGGEECLPEEKAAQPSRPK